MQTIDFNTINPYIIRCSKLPSSHLASSGGCYPPRHVRWYELEYILSGTGYILTNGEKIPTRKDMVFIRTPGMEVQGFLPYYSYSLIFDAFYQPERAKHYDVNDDIFEPSKITDESISLPHFVQVSPHSDIRQLFEDIYQAYLSEDYFNMVEMKASVLKILHTVFTFAKYPQQSRLSPSRLHMQRIDLLTEYIDSHIDHAFTMRELAGVCLLSEGFLCRLFKQIMGTTPFSYINNCKIRRSRQLLIETDLPIKDICMQCGFENESYFYKVFKEKMNISPNEYRKLHRQPYFIPR